MLAGAGDDGKLLGPDHLKVGLLLHSRGLVAYRRKDYSTAENFYRVLSDQREGVGAGASLAWNYVQQSWSSLLATVT